MSELKTHESWVYDYGCRADMVNLSEANKVIAEKDAKILALDSKIFSEKHHAEIFLYERNAAETALRHQKRRRCLAMADWCSMKWFISETEPRNIFWSKWIHRWTQLAEKFKEA